MEPCQSLYHKQRTLGGAFQLCVLVPNFFAHCFSSPKKVFSPLCKRVPLYSRLQSSACGWCRWVSRLPLQFGYAGMNIISKVSLNRGMNHFVLVVYRHAAATVVLLLSPSSLKGKAILFVHVLVTSLNNLCTQCLAR